MNKTLLSFFAGCCLLATANATIIASFGGSGMVSENQGLGGNPTPDYSDAISPASGYTGQTFYGGVVPTNTTVDSWFISNSVARGGVGMPALDWISAETGSTTDGAGTKFHRGVVLFQQSDFLNYSTNPGGVTMDDTSSMQVAVQRSSGNPSRFGFVVQTSESDFYVGGITTYDQFSGTGFDPNFTNGHFLSISDPTSLDWFALNTTTHQQGASATVDFSSIIGVGVWFENERASNSAAGLGWHMTGIEITAIPEPTTYAALFGLLAIGFVLVRRRVRA
ncbi:MAG: PEP-CTERM sorting domain-containing protein [Opitutales bacterium]|nr:PEP-CTERM sorting domain-containing protein [Opitutales bacterium]